MNTGCLNGLTKLEKLELYENKINTLEEIDISIDGLPKVRYLTMSENHIRELKKFKGGERLEKLNRGKNLIKELNQTHFKNLSHLKRIDIYRNKIVN